MVRVLYSATSTDPPSPTGSAPLASHDVDPLIELNRDDRSPLTNRPWVLSNMVTTLDGATAVDGLSGPLGGPADQQVFSAIRSVADVVLAGASTVIEEGYRPPSPSPAVLEARRAAGRADRLVIAVITSSLRLETDLPLFADATYRPLVITTTNAPDDRRQALESVADVVSLAPDDDGRVPLLAALEALGAMGHRTVLSEGGPALNGQLVADDLIDEWNLTLSPLLVGGSSARPAHGQGAAASREVTLARLWEADGLLFGRWVRDRN
jgi:5-amino-6-(5-phosphoribosylamino)uracil reductase